MAERRKNRKKKDLDVVEDDGKPTNDEYSVAKYMRQKLPLKKTSLQGHKVEYFIASKAVDCLLDSPWATNTGPEGVKFTTRDSVVRFLDRMLEHKFFHRAKKIIVNKKKKDQEPISDEKDSKEKEKDSKEKEKDSKEKEKDSKEKEKDSKEKEKDSKKGKGKTDEKVKGKGEEKTKSKEKTDDKAKCKEEKKSKDEAPEKSEDKTKSKEKSKSKDKSDKKTKSEKAKSTEPKMSKAEEESEDKAKDNEDKKETDTGTEKKKEKKKIKLDMHFKQLFLDGNEVYVWIYNPIPMRTWVIGMLMVVGAVLVCLFPLWPQVIRHYIYYLSVAAALFLVFIIALAVVRLIVFIVVWAFTLGKHHLWLLPNLTEDVGFFESFWPLYFYEYKGKKKEEKSSKKSTDKEDVQKAKEKDDSSSDQEKKQDQEESESERESGEEVEKTTTSSTVENGFELVEAEDES